MDGFCKSAVNSPFGINTVLTFTPPYSSVQGGGSLPPPPPHPLPHLTPLQQQQQQSGATGSRIPSKDSSVSSHPPPDNTSAPLMMSLEDCQKLAAEMENVKIHELEGAEGSRALV